MQQHQLAQGSSEWHAHRARHFNASDAPAMLGCSPYLTRSELLQALHTGLRAEPDAATQRRFDDGHRTEDLARPIAEEIIGEELFPVVGSDGELSASFDGLTMLEDTNWECKRVNDDLRAALPHTGRDSHGRNDAAQLPKQYRVQMEQQCAVAGCDRVLFTAAKFDDAGTAVEERHCWYTSDPKLRAEIIAGWKQFAIDLAAYIPLEVSSKAAAVGHSPDQLPSLRSSVKGELVLESNIKEWEAAALSYIKSVRDHELKTDEDFANADAAAKWCDTSKATLEGVKASLMSATGDVNTAVGTLDRIMSELDKTRIAFNNAIKARKEARKGEIVAGGIAAIRKHIDALNERLGKAYMPAVPADFAGAIKGKSSLAKMEDAVATTLAAAKIEANRIADGIDKNLGWLRENAKDHAFLFSDTGTIVLKAHDDLVALAENRITAHKQAEAAKEEAQREKIRKEELARIEREQEAARQAELKREQEASEAAKPAQPPAVAPVAAPAVVSQAPAANSPTVVPLQRAQPAALPTMTLGQINERLGRGKWSEADLTALGFAPAATRQNTKLYFESDFGRLCDCIVAHVRTVQHQQLQAA